MSLEALLSRLEDPRPSGRDRWRAACPVCRGGNLSTLSIGIGDTGVVLLKCWKSGCGPDQIAQAVGLHLADLFPPRENYSAPLQRRRLISPAQALDLLHDEALLIAVAGGNIGRGIELSEDDRSRCLQAAGRIAFLRDEVMA